MGTKRKGVAAFKQNRAEACYVCRGCEASMLVKMSSAIGKRAPGCRRKAELAALSTETMAAACRPNTAPAGTHGFDPGITHILCVVEEHRELASGQISSCSFQKYNWASCHKCKEAGR